MKDFIVAFASIFLASVLYDRITSFIGLDYKLFEDAFDLWLLLASLGIFVGIFVPIYSVLKRMAAKTVR
ncbi:hypothetical protein ACOJQI_10670 [Bacillus salacetis]|uniref:hypothetical protein n=1 Tax=Bacillus salacetis TaxID=2315464 RepID=UPI003BA17EA5